MTSWNVTLFRFWDYTDIKRSYFYFDSSFLGFIYDFFYVLDEFLSTFMFGLVLTFVVEVVVGLVTAEVATGIL